MKVKKSKTEEAGGTGRSSDVDESKDVRNLKDKDLKQASNEQKKDTGKPENVGILNAVQKPKTSSGKKDALKPKDTRKPEDKEETGNTGKPKVDVKPIGKEQPKDVGSPERKGNPETTFKHIDNGQRKDKELPNDNIPPENTGKPKDEDFANSADASNNKAAERAKDIKLQVMDFKRG